MIEAPTSNRSWFLIASIVAFVAITAFAVYFKIQKTSLNGQISRLKVQKEALQAPPETAGMQNAVSSALSIKQALDQIDSTQIAWSKIIEKIENTVPKLKDTNAPIVIFQSYNGNEDGKISVSATTRSDAFDGFADIALLIRAFANDPAFNRVFVPSITKSITPDGATVLSFSFNFEYKKLSF